MRIAVATLGTGWLLAVAGLLATPRDEEAAPPPGPPRILGPCREVTTGIPNEVVAYTYDVLGRPIRHGDVTLTYGADGRLATELWPHGRVEHAYDLGGHEVTTRYFWGDGETPDMVTTRTFTGDRLVAMDEYANPDGTNGRRHRFTYVDNVVFDRVDAEETARRYDSAGRLVSETDSIGETWSYDYDAGGNLIEKSLLWPQGPILVRVTYDYDCWR